METRLNGRTELPSVAYFLNLYGAKNHVPFVPMKSNEFFIQGSNYILSPNLHEASFHGDQLIQDTFSVQLKLDYKFKMYKT